MMKKFLVLAAIAVSALSSQAAYLWWQVEDPSPLAQGEWDRAYIYARNLTNGEKTELDWAANILGNGTGLATVQVSDLGTNFGYYIELVNSSTGALIGYTNNSGSQTYANLSASITTDELEVPTAIWHGGSYSAPEPTSAMLMLLGVAGLALRRKQRMLDEV